MSPGHPTITWLSQHTDSLMWSIASRHLWKSFKYHGSEMSWWLNQGWMGNRLVTCMYGVCNYSYVCMMMSSCQVSGCLRIFVAYRLYLTVMWDNMVVFFRLFVIGWLHSVFCAFLQVHMVTITAVSNKMNIIYRKWKQIEQWVMLAVYQYGGDFIVKSLQN